MPDWVAIRLRPLAFLLLLLGLGLACALSGGSYEEDFSDAGAWRVSQGAGASGEVADGAFQFYVAQAGFYWIEAATPGYGPGSYEVTVNQVAGEVGAGYGFAFYVDPAQETFYLFEIGSDGFAWLGYCEGGCELAEPLVDEGWFATELVAEGLNQPHTLRVTTTAAGSITFYIDGVELATVQDSRLSEGDLALVVEAFATEESVHVTFDDLRFTPE